MVETPSTPGAFRHGQNRALPTREDRSLPPPTANLTRRARQAIQSQENMVLVSAASAWEIAIKSKAEKLDAGPLVADFQREVGEEGFSELSISSDHANRAGLLRGPHKDPFDRMLAAQAQAENLAVISKNKHFDDFGVRRIW